MISNWLRLCLLTTTGVAQVQTSPPIAHQKKTAKERSFPLETQPCSIWMKTPRTAIRYAHFTLNIYWRTVTLREFVPVKHRFPSLNLLPLSALIDWLPQCLLLELYVGDWDAAIIRHIHTQTNGWQCTKAVVKSPLISFTSFNWYCSRTANLLSKAIIWSLAPADLHLTGFWLVFVNRAKDTKETAMSIYYQFVDAN